MAQYISMYPADWENEEEREERIRLWRERDSPKRDAFPGDPREWEKTQCGNSRAHAARAETTRHRALVNLPCVALLSRCRGAAH